MNVRTRSIRSTLIFSIAVLASDLGFGRPNELRTETIGSVPSGFFNLMTRPTEPVDVSRAFTEWDTAQALLVSVPIKQFLQDESVARFYMEYLGIAAKYVPVVIAHDIADTRYLARFEDLFLKDPNFQGKQDRIHLAPTRSQSFWIRDNGPIFGFDSRGELLVLDTIYRSLEGEIEAFSNTDIDLDSKDLAYDFEAFIDYRQLGRNDDVTPLFLSKFIRQDLQTPCDTVRPPIHLQGGDYITDGVGNVFVSEDTVMANGGQKRQVESILKQYFGASEVHVLNALPGYTAKHLDMLLKLLGPSVMLYAEAPLVSGTGSVYNRRLSLQVGSAQETNLRYLRKNFPDMKLVGIPTPPLLEDSSEAVLGSIRAQLTVAVCEQVGINYLRYVKLAKGSPELENARRMIGKEITAAAGRPLDLGKREDLDLACQRFLGSRLDALEQFHIASTTLYRTYANSIVIKTESDGVVLLLPRYKPVEGEQQESFDRYEQQVEAAYRVGYPDAIIHWIDCDVMVRRLGALHCLSMTIPAPLASGLERDSK